MPPRKVYVNLPSHTANGEEVTVTTTKGANKNGARRATWSVSAARGNLGDEVATFVTPSPALEEQPITPGRRTFKNHVKLPPPGGNKYTVTAKKVHDNATVGTSRSLTGVEMVAWRKLYFTINFMDGLDQWADVLGRELPAMLLPAFVEMEQKSPVDTTAMDSEGRVDSDALKRLVRALPAEPYAGQRPTDMAVQPLWLRLALVRTFLGEDDSTAREVAANEVTVTGGSRLVTKPAVINWVYASPGSVTGLELALTENFPLGATPDFDAKSLKVSGSTSTTCTVTVGPGDAFDAANVLRATVKEDVVLYLKWSSGKEERLKADSIDQDGLYFTWTVQGNGHPDRSRWALADQNLQVKRVEVKTRATIQFVDGAAAEGSVAITDTGDQCKITVTDQAWITRLDDFRAGRLVNATLKVLGKTFHSIAGQSSGANIAIAVDEIVSRTGGDQARAQQLLLRVMLHEIIHAVGGVAQTMADGKRHAKFYPEAQGGVATGDIGHCSTGATLADATTLENHRDEQKRKTYEPDKPEIFVPSSSTICVMYHRAYIPHLITAPLCAHCLRAFRVRDLDVHLTTTY